MSENDTLDRLVARIMQLAANAYSEGWDDRGDAGQYEEGGSLLAEYATTAAWLGEQPRDTLRTLLAPLLAAPSPSAAHAEVVADMPPKVRYTLDLDTYQAVNLREALRAILYEWQHGHRYFTALNNGDWTGEITHMLDRLLTETPPWQPGIDKPHLPNRTAEQMYELTRELLSAASPSPGAVEAAAVEYLVAEKANALAESRHKPTMAASMRLTDAYDALVRVLAPWCDDDKCAEYMTGPHYHYDDAGKEFAARRGAAGGQDG